MPLGHRKPEDAYCMEKREIAAFLHAAREVERDARAYYLFALTYVLALRIGEALILEWEHLGPLDARGLPSLVSVPTLKKRLEKPPLIDVPVLSHPRLVLAAFDRRRQPKEERRARSPWLFGGATPGERLSMQQANRLFALCRDAARLKGGYTTHALRHTAATELEIAGMPRKLRERFLRQDERRASDLDADAPQWARFRGKLDLPALKPLAAAR
jgi:integrase